ncbi:unnamed protein product [Clonostachys rosea f. rosea IK726]|uniref:Uncharacterized protein n=1 Tax=Clonostachys rosea f. rosea IK726 TaxID=1349383 RepID=A0ACA9U1L3_BIOOC|nr:unnamed protein product [Clonostachys rosea f. rosea IK726]
MEGQASSWQEVSGPSVFWILLTLGIAAATLPSTRSKITGPSIKVGASIDPLRSMPWVCFLDGIFDLIVVGRTIQYHMSKGEEDAQREEQIAHGEPNLILVKLAMTLLAVLPQTIKILSMRGIPVSQICACAFFFAITTSLIIDLWGPAAEKPYLGKTVKIDERKVKSVTICLALLIHTCVVISELWIWYNIACLLSFEPPASVKNLSFWVNFACWLGLFLQLVVSAIYFCISSHRFAISKYPRIVPLLGIFGFFFTLKGIAESPIEEKVSSTRHIPPMPLCLKRASYSTSLIYCAASVSAITAVLIHALGMLIARKKGMVQQPSGQDVESGTDQPASTAESRESTRRQEQDGDDGSKVRRAISSIVSGIRCLSTLGLRIDQWLWDLFILPSTLSFFASWTIFNLIRTVLYYLVVFDGSGTSSPSWNSVLG